MIQAPTLTAGETKEYYDLGDFFRLMKSTDPVTVRFYYQGRETFVAEGVERGYAERFRSGQFDRFTVHSATAQTISFASRLGNEVSYDVPPTGAVTVSGAVTLDATTLAALEVIGLDAATISALQTVGLDAATLAALEQINVRPELRSASYQQLGSLAANTPDTIFLAAANPNGAILLDAFGSGHSAGAPVQPTFIAKAGTPATVVDGEVIYSAPCVGYGGGTWVNAGDMPVPRFIPPGVGLYFIVTDPATYCMRHCRYKLL